MDEIVAVGIPRAVAEAVHHLNPGLDSALTQVADTRNAEKNKYCSQLNI